MSAAIRARTAFVLRMAWRDSRGSRRRLLLHASSIVLGIAALVAVGSLGSNLHEAMRVAAKGLVGADLVVTSPEPFDVRTAARLAALGGEEARERMFAAMMEFPAGSGSRRLVQVRALEGRFPFYGEFRTEPAGARARLRTGGPVVVLEETLMRQFNLRVGDPVRLGRETFTVAGALRQMPGETVGVAMLAPRAFIPLDALAATGLEGPGALMRYRILLRLPPTLDAEKAARDLRESPEGTRLSTDTVEGRRREMGRTFDAVDDFLNLVGYIALFLGGIGVAAALHAYLGGKVASVAVLRCVGAGSREAVAVYLVQALALGVAGAVVGAALGVALQQGLPMLVRGVLPFALECPVDWGMVMRGMGAGIAICLLFAALPILEVRRIPPLAALRIPAAGREGDGEAGRFDPLRIVLGCAVVGATAGFAVLQAGSAALGIGYTAGLFAVLAILAGLGRLAVLAARRLIPDRLPFGLRQGVANLHRPGNRTTLLLVSVGLGTFLIQTLVFARASLMAEIRSVGAAGRPNLVFFDIQEDEIGTLERVAEQAGVPLAARAPVVTMRIASIRGRPVADLLRDRSARMPGWALRREYRSTFREGLSGSETLVAGSLMGGAHPADGVTSVSVEEGLARDLHLKLGDAIDWDVQGVTVRTRVGSVRAVEWRRMEPNFFFVFPEGVLDDAPKTFIAAVRVSGPADSARVQDAVARVLPTVTAIDLELVEETLDAIFDKVAFAVELVAATTALTGAVVLASCVLASGRQRARESALLKALGASRRQILVILAAEHAVLGLAGGGAGGGLAVVGGALLARLVLKLPPQVPPMELAAGVAAAAVLTVATGIIGGWCVADAPPMEVLRQEG